MNKSPLRLFASHRPEQVFAYIGCTPVLFVDFIADVQVLSEQLLKKQGDVLISCQSRYAFSVALLAAWQVGKVAILLSNTNHDVLTKVGETFDIAYCCDDEWAKAVRQTTDSPVHQTMALTFPPEQVGVRLYTSGSTGEPKVIEKTLGSLWYEVESLESTLSWSASPLVASVPAYHLYGLTFSVLLPWCLGVPLVDEMPLHADEVETCFAQTGAKILVTVPIHLKALIGANVDLTTKQCIVSAAALSHESAKVFRQKYHADALEIYGSSETGVVAYRKQLEDEVWTCFPQVHVAADETGLLEVSSPFIYVQNTGDLDNNVFCSADKVVLHDDKHFTLEGRMDAIVKIAGKRISIVNIEQCLMRCQGVQDAAVIAVPAKSAVRDWAIWAAIAVDDEASCDLLAIKRELRTWVDGVAIPRRMVKITRLPRESNGKLPKKKLMELFTHV